ncbi:hypothetical protein D918_07824 [Trichuris suis]|nr:hypothetical protein D918_07824 [Trichuris suis]
MAEFSIASLLVVIVAATSSTTMPGGKAPRFTQKPVIKQTPEGDLLMECLLESYQKPRASWFHGTTSIEPGDRYELSLKSLGKEEYLAALLIKVGRFNLG